MRGTWQTTDSGGSGIGAGVLVVLAVIVAAAIARPVVHAAAELAEVLVIAAAVILGLALTAGAALVAVRMRRGRRSAALMVHRVTPVTQQAAEPLPAPQRAAIGAPKQELHLHFHGVTAEDVAAIIKQTGGKP